MKWERRDKRHTNPSNCSQIQVSGNSFRTLGGSIVGAGPPANPAPNATKPEIAIGGEAKYTGRSYTEEVKNELRIFTQETPP